MKNFILYNKINILLEQFAFDSRELKSRHIFTERLSFITAFYKYYFIHLNFQIFLRQNLSVELYIYKMSYADIKGMKLAMTDYEKRFDCLNKVLIIFVYITLLLLKLDFFFICDRQTVQSKIQALNTNSYDAEKRIEGRIGEWFQGQFEEQFQQQFLERFERLERIHYNNQANYIQTIFLFYFHKFFKF